LGALYTPEELRSTLDAGFVGRPAIGARLRAEIPHGDIGDIEGCDQVTESIEAAGAEEVTIVLVGSAFGGTGASGLPAIGHALRGRIRRRLGHPAASLKLVGVLCLPHFRSGESLEPTDRMAEHPALRAEHEGHLWRAQNALRYLETHSNAQDAPAIFDALYIHGSPQPQQYRGRLGAPEHNDLPHWIELLTVATIRDVRATRPDPVAPAPAIWRRTHARQAWGDVTDGPQLRERLGAFAQFSRFVATQVAPCLPDIPGHASRREPRFYRNSIAPNYLEEAQGYHDLVRYCDSFTQWFSEIHDNPTPDGSARLMEYGQDDLPKAGDASDPSRRRSRGCRRDQQASRVATELSRASAGCVGIHRFSEACLNACRALVG
jgi:hypothetical protein